MPVMHAYHAREKKVGYHVMLKMRRCTIVFCYAEVVDLAKKLRTREAVSLCIHDLEIQKSR